MISNTSISRCLKSDFKAFEQKSEKSFILAWGKKDEVERVSVLNEETGEHEYTGEVVDTDWCTYESGMFTGILSTYWLDKSLDGKSRIPSVSEYKAIYDGMGLSEEEQLPLLKEKLGHEIDRYDSSDAVNSFTIGGVKVWLDKATRSGLLLRFQSEAAIGKTGTTLWYNGMKFDLTIESGIQMLYALEVYASASYDHTQQKKVAKDALESVEAVLAFDVAEGYPEKLAF